ncbi:hypothetical protein [Endozoicomonas sp. 8E]|uniref:hypothetical protein n=1 Tax=Endozoicomonas sp. 8E TaxID=3035692 RepID=UPI002939510C|nr:hypothetical protein [Endozoicomonas sp. 8E]WOG27619.1 hypothetical protein P6910_24235 [Endozoicomonas sp. 8E]
MTYPIKSAAGPSFVSDPKVNENVEMPPEAPCKCADSSATDSLHRFSAVMDTLSLLRKGMTVEKLPDRPEHCQLLYGDKSLMSRKVVASSLRCDSSTDSGKLEDREAEILAELGRMDRRTQEDYQQLSRLHSQHSEAMDVALKTEKELKIIFPFYNGAMERQSHDQQEIGSLFGELQEQYKILDTKDEEVGELVRKNQDLTRELESSRNKLFKLQNAEDIITRNDATVRLLENSLREANRRLTSMQGELNTLRQEKTEKSQPADKQDKDLAKVQPDPNVDKDTLSTILKEKTALSERIEDLERLLEDARDRSKAAQHLVNDMNNEMYAQAKQLLKLEKSLKSADRNASEHASAVKKERAEKHRLSGQLNDLEKHLSIAQHATGYYQKKAIDAQIKLIEQSRRIEQLENELRQKGIEETEASPDQAR